MYAGEITVIVLGIDPGYAIIGYGVIDYKNNYYSPVSYGAITTNAGTEFEQRLEIIFDSIDRIIKKSRPDAVAIEKLYFQTNQKTAIDVAQARGVILLAAKKNNIPIFEYTPLQVKTTVTGYGKAKKHQVMDMTKRLLKLEKVPKPDDTADALAIAICHTQAAGSPLRQMMIKRGIG